MVDYLWNMTTKAPKISRSKLPSKEAQAMSRNFKEATDAARKAAFKNRKTVLTERDGWLVRIKKDGSVWRRVKRVRDVTELAA